MQSNPTPKRPYEPPKLTTLGPVAALTQTGTPPGQHNGWSIFPNPHSVHTLSP